jgi:diguanylate cyclase (GGDEF)-like protein
LSADKLNQRPPLPIKMSLSFLFSIRVWACWLALAMAAQAQQYVFRVFRQPEGLQNLAVNDLAADRSGFLWVATENGLYRFLGSNFQRFGREQGLQEGDIHDLLVDPSGDLWVGTEENLYRWDGERFQPAGREKIRIPGARRMAVEDSNHLLIVSEGRLYRLEHDGQGRMLSYLPVFSEAMAVALPDLKQVGRVGVVRDAAGAATVWLGCGSRLCSLPAIYLGAALKPQAVTVWGKAQGVPEERWESVLLDRSGTLWAAGRNHIAVLSKGAEHFLDRSIPGADPENIYGHAPMIEDREGRVIVTAEDGIARWQGSAWQHIGQASGLSHSSRITGMVFDASGDLWLGSLGGGLYGWLGYRDWQGWGEGQNLPSVGIWSILPVKDGRVLVGTDRGMAWVNPRSGASGNLQAGGRWKLGQIGSLTADAGGTVWAGTFLGGILRIDPKTGAAVKTATLPAYIYSSVELPGGHTLYATGNGIWGSQPDQAPRRFTAADALLGDKNLVVAACAAPDSTGWFLASNRLLHFAAGAWSRLAIDGLPTLDGSLLALACAPDGTLWVTGQRTGTWHLTPGGGHLQAAELNLPEDLRQLAPLSIFVDRRGWVWVGSDQGLAVWNGNRWRHLTQESGLIWNDVNQGAMIGGEDGSLWVGTSGGLAQVMHPEHLFDPLRLSASLTAIHRGGRNFPLGRDLTLPWSAKPLEFQFSSPTMRNRSELMFKYRLEGLQADWSEDRSGVFRFPALPAGEYTLLAMACNPGLDACSEVLKVHLKILAPWWRSYWFYALCMVLLVLLAVLAERLRERQLHAASRHLEELVGERTRELEFSREQLRVQATHDGLTGMLNRRGILKALTKEMERTHRENRSLIVALVDLDHFKRINDSYGHLTGDEALRWFAAAVGAAVRSYDHAGRYGGEEFLLVLTEVPNAAAEARLAALHACISNLQVQTRECSFKINCSVGATVVDAAAGFGSLEAVLAVADQALYDAKAAGRNCVVLRRAGPDSSQPSDGSDW